MQRQEGEDAEGADESDGDGDWRQHRYFPAGPPSSCCGHGDLARARSIKLCQSSDGLVSPKRRQGHKDREQACAVAGRRCLRQQVNTSRARLREFACASPRATTCGHTCLSSSSAVCSHRHVRVDVGCAKGAALLGTSRGAALQGAPGRRKATGQNSGTGCARNFGRNRALKARMSTKFGASGSNFGHDVDVQDPEPGWPSSARPAREPRYQLQRQTWSDSLCARVWADVPRILATFGFGYGRTLWSTADRTLEQTLLQMRPKT